MSNDKELEEIFSFENSNDKQNKLMKKAKKKSNLKIAAMSLLTVTLVSIVIGSLKLQLSPDIFHQTIKNRIYYNDIFGADGFYGEFFSDIGLTFCESDVYKYKIINGKPVITDNIKVKGDFWGRELDKNKIRYQKPSIVISDMNEWASINEAQGYTSLGQRLMKFYHPKINYLNYSNDINNLDKVSVDKNIEMGLSFDKEYSIEEIQKMIPKDIVLNWYWVNTFDDEEIDSFKANEESKKPNIIFNEYEVVGFSGINEQGEKLENPEQKFIDIINEGLKVRALKNNFKSVYEDLKGENGDIQKDNIKIIGAVVSGKRESLKQLQNIKEIKASSFGIITDEY